MSLTDYRRKRNFEQTSEPSGQLSRLNERPIFVVQLHRASHRHYDFRLQVGDLLKSWAVPKGPSLNPAVKRLAAQVEDHPLDYASFEGEIPKGQYGGGHVVIFDQGIWSTETDPQAQLDKGHLRFELFGQHLKGAWHLVRSSRKSRTPEWLLIKQADMHASDREADDFLGKQSTPVSQKQSQRKSKVSKWRGVAARLQRSRPAPASDQPFAPQLAETASKAPDGEAWIYELKWDGYRLLATIAARDVRLWARSGIEWTRKLPEMVSALQQLGLDSAALDGELIAQGGTQADFGILQATLAGQSQAALTFMLFDILHLDGISLEDCALHERKTLLQQLLKEAPAQLRYSSHIVGNGQLAFELARQKNFEGIICKRADQAYRHERSSDWRKVKNIDTQEFAVVGFTPPKGSRTAIGALLLARSVADDWHYAGRVGSGMSDAQLKQLDGLIKTLGSQKSPTVKLDPAEPGLREARWFAPAFVVEVHSRGTGSRGLLRQPSLKAIRLDKSIKDLQMTEANALPPVLVVKQSSKRSRIKYKLTHPERLVFPEQAISKQQVADYYAEVMPHFLPEIVGRPLSILRCPDGISGTCFFQKHGHSGLGKLGSVTIKEKDGTDADYLVVENADQVMQLVQFNAIEFHPWGALAADPELADRLVFDLDPGPDVDWRQTCDAALLLRDLLLQIHLRSFLRTSGGKGLHLVVPLLPHCDWAAAKRICQGVAHSMVKAHPDRFVAVTSKSRRVGKIFIDYLRNSRGATSIASYSLRARPGAAVATPLEWRELTKLKSAADFDIHSLPKRLSRMRHDPWAGIESIRQDLSRWDPE